MGMLLSRHYKKQEEPASAPAPEAEASSASTVTSGGQEPTAVKIAEIKVADLAEFLKTVTDLEAVKGYAEGDARKSAADIYAARIKELESPAS